MYAVLIEQLQQYRARPLGLKAITPVMKGNIHVDLYKISILSVAISIKEGQLNAQYLFN